MTATLAREMNAWRSHASERVWMLGGADRVNRWVSMCKPLHHALFFKHPLFITRLMYFLDLWINEISQLLDILVCSASRFTRR